MTQAQKMEQRYADLRKCIGKRVQDSMDNAYLTQEKMAKAFSMGHTTIRKITDGEEVKISTTDFLKVLDFAGLKLVDTRKDIIQRGEEQ
jgi:hypothetical protein